tara:strand:+ start:101 stop:319 length:219 start_codon:yes stop_codon:yes gene_type:complete
MNKKETDRLTQVEIDTKSIDTKMRLLHKDVEVIRDNHLVHLAQDIKKLDMRLWAVLIILVASVFIPFVSQFL